MREVTCNNCGWVHIAVTSQEARMNRHNPDKCFRCGENYKNFREAKVGDCPRGSTIQAILDYREFNYQEGISF